MMMTSAILSNWMSGLPVLVSFVVAQLIPQAPNRTQDDTLCIDTVLKSLSSSPMLLAFSKPQESTPISFSYLSSVLNSTITTVDQNCVRHFPQMLLHVDAGLIFLNCERNADPILLTIKNNRFISEKMRLILLIDIRCQNAATLLELVKNLLNRVRVIVQPAFAGVLIYGGATTKMFWIFPHDVKETLHEDTGLQCTARLPGKETFRGYVFKASAAATEPYVLSLRNSRGWVEGVEVRIILMVSASMGMDVQWVDVPAGESPRVLQDNTGRYIGMFGMLHRLEADIAFGGIRLQPWRLQVAEILFPHTIDSLTWAIPAPPAVQNWGAATSVFSAFTWLLIFSVVAMYALVSGLTLWFTDSSLSCQNAFHLSAMYTWAVLLDQGTAHNHRHFLASAMFFLYLLYCLIMTNAYRSALITALTGKAQTKWYETPEQVVADGEKSFIMISGMELYRMSSEDDILWRTILQPDRHEYIVNFTVLDHMAISRHGMVLCILQSCKSIIQRSLLNRALEPMVVFLKKRYLPFPVSFHTAPGSPLNEEINIRTIWLQEAGLVDLWFDEINFSARLKAFHKGLMFDDVFNGPAPLSLLQLHSVFVFFLISLSASLLSFLTEIFQKRKVKQ